MFNIKQFVNKITGEGTAGRDAGSAASTPAFVDQEEQHSAEGFLCPLCMTAFASPEILEEHYQKTHDETGDKSISSSNSNGDIGDLRQEIMHLQTSLAEERNSSEELKREVMKMQADFFSKDEMDNASLKSLEKESEGAKTLLMSEVALLRQQLATELQEVSKLKAERDMLGQKLLSMKADCDKRSQQITSLEVQLAHKNTIDDAAVLRQELVSVQQMMDKMAIEKESECEALKVKAVELEAKLKENEIEYNEKIRETVLDYESKILTCTTQNVELTSELKSTLKIVEMLEKEDKEVQKELKKIEGLKAGAETECTELKAVIVRLQEQHAELRSKIEGGEGAKAALDSYQKENVALKAELFNCQARVTELSKNVYNLKQEVDKTKDEYISMFEVCNEQREIAAEALLLTHKVKEMESTLIQNKEKYDQLKEVYSQLEKSLAQSEEKYDQLKKEYSQQEKNLAQSEEKYDQLKKEYSQQEKNLAQSEEKYDQLKEEVVQNMEMYKNLAISFESKVKEVTVLKAKLQESASSSLELAESINSLRVVEAELRENISNSVLQLETAKSEAQKITAELNSVRQELSKSSETCKKKCEEVEAAQIALQKSKTAFQNLEKERNELNLALEESKLDTKSKIQILEANLEASVDAHTEVSKKLESAEKSIDELQAKLSKEIKQYETSQVSTVKEIEELKQVIKETKLELSKSEAKIEQLQCQTDEVLKDKIELEKKFKASEEGQSRLMERCLSRDADCERLQANIEEFRRKLDDSNSALQELGRENQSFQMESAKAQGRKWTDDSTVTTCISCTKEFTLTIRKHHCRHCGQIFCNECSSRSASVPSCKKPARVCDICYDELTSK